MTVDETEPPAPTINTPSSLLMYATDDTTGSPQAYAKSLALSD